MFVNYSPSKQASVFPTNYFFYLISSIHFLSSVICFSISASLDLFIFEEFDFANIIFSSNSNSQQSLTSFLSLKETRLMKKLNIAGVSTKFIYFDAFIFNPDSSVYPSIIQLLKLFRALSNDFLSDTRFIKLKLLLV